MQELEQIKGEIKQFVYNGYQSILKNECLCNLFAMTQMGLNASYWQDIQNCFQLQMIDSDDGGIDIDIEIDVGQEFALIQKTRDNNVHGNSTLSDQQRDDEHWLVNDNGMNLDTNLQMIIDNVKIRAKTLQSEVQELYSPIIEDIVSNYIQNRVKAVIG